MIGTSFQATSRIVPLIAALALLGSCKSLPKSSTVQGAVDQVAGDKEYARIHIQDHLADPDVLKVNNDLYFLAGTGANTFVSIPIYESKDLEHFTLKRNYEPDGFDKEHDYCQLWAPDLSVKDGTYYLFFSATRVDKSKTCPANEQPTTYFATAKDDKLEFGPPQPFRLNESGPHATFTPGCPPDGCRNGIRIDSAVINDKDAQWFFYVWFQTGNNIASFRMDDPSKIINNVGPNVYPTPADEENINEGPDVFRRGPWYYFFFSAGHYKQQYSMRYIMADSIDKLTREREVHRNSQPMKNSQGRFVQTHGHNTIAERNGEYYNFFHQWVYDKAGNLSYRDTFRQKMKFRADGTIVAMNFVDVNWTPLPNQQYSLDIVTKNGDVIAPCMSVATIQKNPSVRYTGICPDAGDRMIPKDEIAAFRVYWSDNGIMNREKSKEIAYDGYSDDIFADLKGDAVRLNWSWKENHKYSLDVVTKSGEVIAPCINADTLGHSTAVTYTGSCPAANNRAIPKSEIASFRVFWADDNVWGANRKKDFTYDSQRSQIYIDL